MRTSTTTTQQTVVPDTSSVERHGYLFGFPIAHSMSPLFHNTVYADLGLNWNQFYLESTDMELFKKLRQDPKFYGKHQRLCSAPLLEAYKHARRISDNAAQDGYSATPG